MWGSGESLLSWFLLRKIYFPLHQGAFYRNLVSQHTGSLNQTFQVPPSNNQSSDLHSGCAKMFSGARCSKELIVWRSAFEARLRARFLVYIVIHCVIFESAILYINSTTNNNNNRQCPIFSFKDLYKSKKTSLPRPVSRLQSEHAGGYYFFEDVYSLVPQDFILIRYGGHIGAFVWNSSRSVVTGINHEYVPFFVGS